MKNLLKNKTIKSLIISCIIILSLLLLLIILPLFFQDKIINVVLSEANKKLKAKISLSYFRVSLIRDFPSPTLILKDLNIENKELIKKDTLLNIKSLSISFNLFSIFKDRYEINKIVINKCNANFITNENNISNWYIFYSDSTKKDEKTTDKSNFGFKINKLVLKNSNITYKDIPNNIDLNIKTLNIALKGDLSLKETNLQIDLSTDYITLIKDKITYLNQTKIIFHSNIYADLEKNRYKFLENLLYINNLSLFFNGWIALNDENIDLDMKLQMKENSFKSILSIFPSFYKNDFDKIKADGKINFNAFVKGKLYKNIYPDFGLNLDISNALFQYDGFSKGVKNINIEVAVDHKAGILDNTVVNLKNCHLEIVENPINIKATIYTPVSDPDINLNIDGLVDLSSIKQIYPLENNELTGVISLLLNLKGKISYIEKEQYDKFTASGKLEVNKLKYKIEKDASKIMNIVKANVLFSSKYMDLEQIYAIYAKNDINVNGKIENYIPYFFKKDAILYGKLNIGSNYLNISELSSLFKSEEVKSNTKQEQSKVEDENMTLIMVPENLNCSLNLAVKKLVYNKIEMNDAALFGKIVNKQVDINNISASLFNGDIKISGNYKTPNKEKGYANIDVKVNAVTPKQLAKTFDIINAYLPILEKSEGKISLSMQGSMELDKTMTPDYSTINLFGNIKTSNLQIINSFVVTEVINALKLTKLNKMSLNDVNLNYKIEKGQMETAPFGFKIKNTNVEVEKGYIGLDKSIKYITRIEIPKSETGKETQAIVQQIIGKVKNVNIPVKENEKIEFAVKIAGTLNKPVVGFAVEKEEIKEIVTEQVASVVNKALEDAKIKANKIIEDAQNKAEELIKAEKEAGEKMIEQAKIEAEKQIAASKNPIEKASKQIVADKLITEAQKKADQANEKAKQQAQKLISDAQKKANDLIEQAKNN